MATTYYMNKDTGNDASNGLTKATAVKTEAKAKQLAAVNGDEINCLSRGVTVKIIRNVNGTFVSLD